MKLPLTLHPANHLGVQCLLLHAALCSDSTAGRYGQDNRYDTAASIARLRTRYDWESQHGPSHIVRLSRCWQEFLHPPAAVAAAASVPGRSTEHSSSLVPASSKLATAQQPRQEQLADASYRTLAFTAPARLVALYAPPVLLRRLQRRTHDIVSYDAAVHHESLLTKLLAPYGLHVALTGATRRGCPCAIHSEYLLCLTEAATCEVEAADLDSAYGEVKPRGDAGHAIDDHDDRAWGSGASAATTVVTAAAKSPMRGAQYPTVLAEGMTKQRRRATGMILRDALMLGPRTLSSPSPPSPPPAAAVVAAHRVATEGHAATAVAGGIIEPHLQQCIRGSFVGPFRRRYCDRREAFSSTDHLSPTVTYRMRRALDGLIRCGYVVSAADVFPPSQAQLEKRQAMRVTVRYDPHRPTQVPAPACTDPVVLGRLQLHELVLRVCPWHAFAARQLFLTGPAAFTAHLTLRALEHGFDVNMNGAFTSWTSTSTHNKSGTSSTIPAAAAAIVASKAHRGQVQQVHGEGQPKSQRQRSGDLVEQRILEDEDDLFSLARLPHVDPMLRGLYCQRHLL